MYRPGVDHVFVRFGRRGPGTEQRSGLTGSPDIPDPPREPRDLRTRIRDARTAAVATVAVLPRVVGRVWRASPSLTIGLAFATVIGGLMPAATAFVSKLLVDAVVHGIQVRANPALPDITVLPISLPWTQGGWRLSTTEAIVALAGLQFFVAALSALFGTVRNITQQLLQDRVATSIQLQVMRHAARLDLAFFEDSTSYDLLRRARQFAFDRKWGATALVIDVDPVTLM